MDSIRSLFGAFRRPRSLRTLTPPARGDGDFVVTLATGPTPRAAAERLLTLVGAPQNETVLLLPSMPSRPPSGSHPQVVAALIETLGSRARLGIPAGTALPIRRRWANLASGLGGQAVTLGQQGWDRIALERAEFQLDEVFLPSELRDASMRLAIPALRDEGLVLGFWRQIAHPHTRLRVRGNENRARLEVELCAAVQSTYVLDANRLANGLATNLVAWTEDPVAAELVGLGMRRYFEAAQGHESVSPWEDEQVQAATEIGLGPLAGSNLLLRADSASSQAREIANYLVDELGCRVEWLTEGDVGG